jgi:RimJ/RimL family protein N-acetyltransferase
MLPDLTRDDVFSFETARMWLRWPRIGDREALHRMAMEERVAGMTGTWPHPLPDDEAEKRIFRMRKSNAEGQGLALALVMKGGPQQLFGTIGGSFEREGGPEAGGRNFGFGYMLAPEFWGRGLMTEAAIAYADLIFAVTTAEALWATAMQRNPASCRVLEKAGFRLMGTREEVFTARGTKPIACAHYGLVRAEWRARSLLVSSNWQCRAKSSPSPAAKTTDNEDRIGTA